MIAVVQHVPEWLKQRYAWYIQTFNIANYTLDLLAAWATAHVLLDASWLIGDEAVRTGAAWVAAAVVFVAVNHVVLAVMLRLGRGHSGGGAASSASRASRRISCSRRWESWSRRPGRRTAGWSCWCSLRWSSSTGRSPSRCSRRRRASTRRRACSTRATSPRRSAKSSIARRGSSGRSRCSWSISTSCARSTTRTATSPATPSCRASRPSSGRSYATATSLRASAARSSASSCRRRRARRLSRPPNASGVPLPRPSSSVETSTDPIRRRSRSGLLSFPSDGSTANELIHRADIAVYDAKLQGRNRVAVASGERSPAPDGAGNAARAGRIPRLDRAIRAATVRLPPAAAPSPPGGW